MSSESISRRTPISAAHVELGRELKRARDAAGLTQRDISGFSSGHVSNVENGHVMPSRDLVDAYVNIGGDRVRLTAALMAARRVSEDRKRARRMPTRVHVPELITPDSPYDVIRASYRVEKSEHLYVVDERRVIVSATAIYGVRTLQDDARHFVFYRRYFADVHPGVMSVSPGMGCRLSRSVDSYDGGLYFVLELIEPVRLSDSGLQIVSFKISVNSDVVAAPIVQFRLAETVQHAVRVQFTEPALPDRVWSFRRAPGPPTALIPLPDEVLPHSPAGFYSWDFHSLQNEDCGLAWEFKDPII